MVYPPAWVAATKYKRLSTLSNRDRFSPSGRPKCFTICASVVVVPSEAFFLVCRWLSSFYAYTWSSLKVLFLNLSIRMFAMQA